MEKNLYDLSLFSEFRNSPLGLIDVGCRGSIFKAIHEEPSLIGAMAFDPDLEAVEALEQVSHGLFNKFIGNPIALGDKCGQAELKCLTASVNDSLLNPVEAFGKRYGLTNWTVVKKVMVELQTMDHVLYSGDVAKETYWGEFIKLDTQGTEYEILQGAKKILKERTMGIVCETSFDEFYEGQKLFSELDPMLREAGFTFYGFYNDIYKSNQFLNKHKQIGSERLIQGDAVYFKDPINNSTLNLSERNIKALFLSAYIMRYYDFCIELAKIYFVSNPELNELLAIVNRKAILGNSFVVDTLKQIQQIVNNNPELAEVALGKLLVDRFKGSWNYDNIPMKIFATEEIV